MFMLNALTLHTIGITIVYIVKIYTGSLVQYLIVIEALY